MNKKYLILGGGIALILLIGIVLSTLLQQSPAQQRVSPQPSSSLKQDTAAFQQIHQRSPVATITLAPPSNTPQASTKQFYEYYTAAQSNPLADGAYKTNPYLSPEFKQVIGALYKNGNVPVFCPENRRTNIVVGQEVQVNYTTGVLMQEVISEAPPGTKDLYRVMLKNVGGKWLIYDINCITS